MASSLIYPEGSGGLKFKNVTDGANVRTRIGVGMAFLVVGVLCTKRIRATIAQVNQAGGLTLLAALPGYKYRLEAAKAIAIGGAAATGTTVDILGTQAAASVKLAAFAQASLTQSTVLDAGGAGAAVLADGASFVACDANTPILISKTGSAFTVATNIDVIISFTIE